MIDSDRIGKLFFCCVIIGALIVINLIAFNEDARDILLPHNDRQIPTNGATRYTDTVYTSEYPEVKMHNFYVPLADQNAPHL